VTVAALFVEEGGAYYGIPDVDPWPEARDARLYPGPYSVVAHPPCNRWAQPLAQVNQTRYGHRVGDDGGCFASALASVRRWGGVLEHPANTAAWDVFDLPQPPASGGWIRAFCGGWTCHVEQAKYGHPARKATWLYAFSAPLPDLRWGRTLPSEIKATVSWLTDPGPCGARRRITRREAAASPPEFRDVLLDMARNVARGAP
jgi:hypothetical protein